MHRPLPPTELCPARLVRPARQRSLRRTLATILPQARAYPGGTPDSDARAPTLGACAVRRASRAVAAPRSGAACPCRFGQRVLRVHALLTTGSVSEYAPSPAAGGRLGCPSIPLPGLPPANPALVLYTNEHMRDIQSPNAPRPCRHAASRLTVAAATDAPWPMSPPHHPCFMIDRPRKMSISTILH